MHKSGLITFDCSNLMIRNRNLLTNALDITPAYLKNKNSDAGTVVDYRNWTLFLGRRFRSLKIYFVLRSYGIEGVQSHLRKLIDLSKRFESLVVGEEGFELFVPRSLSLVVFRLIMKDSVDTESKEVLQDKLNRTFYRLISEDHTIQLTSTLLGSKFVIRIAVGSPRTTTFHVDKAWKTILAVAIAAKKEIEL